MGTSPSLITCRTNQPKNYSCGQWPRRSHQRDRSTVSCSVAPLTETTQTTRRRPHEAAASRPVAAYENNIREVVVVCEQKEVLRSRTDSLASSQPTIHEYSAVQLWTSFDELSEMIEPFSDDVSFGALGWRSSASLIAGCNGSSNSSSHYSYSNHRTSASSNHRDPTLPVVYDESGLQLGGRLSVERRDEALWRRRSDNASRDPNHCADASANHGRLLAVHHQGEVRRQRDVRLEAEQEGLRQAQGVSTGKPDIRRSTASLTHEEKKERAETVVLTLPMRTHRLAKSALR